MVAPDFPSNQPSLVLHFLGSRMAAPDFPSNQPYLFPHFLSGVTAPGFPPNPSLPEASVSIDSTSAPHFSCSCKVRAFLPRDARDAHPGANGRHRDVLHKQRHQQQHPDAQQHHDDEEERQQEPAKVGKSRGSLPRHLWSHCCAPRQCHQIDRKGDSRGHRPHLRDHDGLTASSSGRS